uniref:Secreted protein n=1 Tax=Arundo donax TaxID=35708 RepID=A0A0A8YHM8_ARUDO
MVIHCFFVIWLVSDNIICENVLFFQKRNKTKQKVCNTLWYCWSKLGLPECTDSKWVNNNKNGCGLLPTKLGT